MTTEWGTPYGAFEAKLHWAPERGGTNLPSGAVNYGRIHGTVASGVLTASDTLKPWGYEAKLDTKYRIHRYELYGLYSRGSMQQLQGWDWEYTLTAYPQAVSGHTQLFDPFVMALGSSLCTTDDGGISQDPWGSGYAPALKNHIPSFYMEKVIQRGSTVWAYLAVGCKVDKLKMTVSPPEGIRFDLDIIAQDVTQTTDSGRAYTQTIDGQAISSTNQFGNTGGVSGQYSGGVATTINLASIPSPQSGNLYPYTSCGIKYLINTTADYDIVSNISSANYPLNLNEFILTIDNKLRPERSANISGRKYIERAIPQGRDVILSLKFDALSFNKIRDLYQGTGYFHCVLYLGGSGKALVLKNGVLHDPKLNLNPPDKIVEELTIRFTDPNRTGSYVQWVNAP